MLAGVGAAAAGLGGCIERLSPGGPPGYTRWLYDPATVLPADRRGFLTLAVDRALRERDRLPGSVVGPLERLDRQYDALDLSAVERLTTQAYGTGTGRFAATAVLEGSFDPGAVAAALRERTAGGEATLDARGTYRDYRLYAYAPDYLAGALGAPDGAGVSLGFGLRTDALVVGAAVHEAVTGVEAARAAVDAAAAQRRRYYAASVDARTVVDALEGATLVGGVALPSFRRHVPAGRETLRAVADDLRAVGTGASLAGATTKLVLVYGSPANADPGTVRSLLERDGGDGGVGVERIAVTADGRGLVVTTTLDPAELPALYRNGSLGTRDGDGTRDRRGDRGGRR